jgi:poly-gamma-glutamate synthesis protein (capsule biosynthesis protein)
MIFVGDIALPFSNSIKYDTFPSHFYKKKWIGNLEGAVITKDNNSLDSKCVFNDKGAIKDLTKKFEFSGFLLANNHIFDSGSYQETTDFLNKNNTPYAGIGKDLKEASKPLIIKENNTDVVILNFGWEVIQCEIAKKKATGVNPLEKDHVLSKVKEAIINYPNAKVVTFMHWNYELEAEPQPFERVLAKKLIDIGVSAVIGAHPHRIGGFEIHKGKPIVYSLGNWMFKQNEYFGGKLKFPDFSSDQLAVEIDFSLDELKFHFFKHENSEISYKNTEGIDSVRMLQCTPFKDLSDEEYTKWYSKNHYHKNKGLPIYFWNDPSYVVKIKNKTNKLRDYLLKIYLLLK